MTDVRWQHDEAVSGWPGSVQPNRYPPRQPVGLWRGHNAHRPALRSNPEKLAILEFPQFIEAPLVTRSETDICAFHAQHGTIILKPLDGMGGTAIFKAGTDDLNSGS